MAQTQLYTKKAQVFVKEETGQDTYITQLAGDAILAEIGDTPFTIDGENYSPTTVRGDFLTQDESPGLITATVTFRVPLHGSAAKATAPEFGEALKACGYLETTNGTASVDYVPTSTFDGNAGNPGPSYSVTVLEDGLAYQLKGSFGNVVFTGEVGLPMFMEFTFTGAYQGVIADALETATYNTPVAPAFMGATFATNIGGAYTPKGVQNFVLDTGNNVVAVADINETNGIYGARITDRRSFGSYDPEMVLVATEDFYGNQRAGTAGTITTGVIGPATGNWYTLSIARCVLRPVSQASRDGVRTLEVPFAVSSAGTDAEDTNDDITLLFT